MSAGPFPGDSTAHTADHCWLLRVCQDLDDSQLRGAIDGLAVVAVLGAALLVNACDPRGSPSEIGPLIRSRSGSGYPACAAPSA